MSALAGRTIALPETRELDRLAGILEAEGAVTLRCPLVAILDAPDPRPVDAWLHELVITGFHDLVFLTGEGVRRLLARGRAIGIEPAVLTAFGQARRITRGPKPARALHEVNLSVDLPAAVPTSRGVIDTLAPLSLDGRRIGVQLYGTEPNEPLVRFLESRGAVVRTVAPYIYAPASDEDRVVDLIRRLERGAVDALAFTSASQVDRLWAVALGRQLEPALRAGLGRTRVAAIGPVVAEALKTRGVAAEVQTEAPFIMKRMVAALAGALAAQGG